MNQQMLMIYLPLLTPLATLAIVMVGFLYNNSRLSDFRSSMGDMRSSMGDMRTELRGSMNDMRDMLRAEMRVLQTTMEKNHSELLGKFAELDTRVSRIEQRFN